MAQLDSRTLEIFRAVAATGSATRAAATLNTTQPNITRAIGAFENECGFPLFERGRYGMTLTEAGRQLLDVVERNWAGLQTVAQAMAEMRASGPPGTLYAVGVPVVTEGEGGTLLSDYIRDQPKVSLCLKVSSRDQAVAEILTGGSDIGMIIGPPPLGTNLEVTCVGHSRLAAVVAPHHRLANRSSVDPAELHGEQFVQLLRPNHIRYAVDAMLANQGVLPGRVHEVSTQRTLIEIVRNSDAVGFADSEVIRNCPPGWVVSLALEPATTWPINLIHNGNRSHSAMLERFLEWLAKRPPADG